MSVTLGPGLEAGVTLPSARERAVVSRQWLTLCWLVVLVLGACQAWDVHWQFDPDGVAYLDMGDAFFKGNWQLALNGLWPPLDAWLIGPSHWLFHITPQLEI